MSTTHPVPATIVQPDHGAYDDARRAWNLAVDQYPAAVVVARTVGDVREAVAFARRQHLRVAVQGTGHRAGALPALDDTLLLRTALEGGVDVDPASRRVRVPAGTLWQDAVAACAAHDLVPLCGSAGDVGVVGYTLGGGLSLLGRRYGLAANHVTAIELVTADGTLVRTDRDTEPELLWALLGGGGGTGVVTAIEFTAHRAGPLFAGTTFWPAEAAAEVLGAWAAWATDAPEDVTTSARILRLPPLPHVPEPLRGTPVVAIDGVVLGEPGAAVPLLAPWREVGTPMIDTWAPVSIPELLAVHGDPPEPVPAAGGGMLLRAAPPEALAELVRLAGAGSDCSLLFAELRQLGGALGRRPADAGLAGHLDAGFALFSVGVAPTPEAAAAAEAQTDALIAALAPWHADHGFLNHAERPGEATEVHAAADAERLRAVRRAWDPDGVFVVSHA